MLEPGHTEIPIYRQCELMGLSRAGYYYEPQGESPLNLNLMNFIDEQYTRTPFYGVEKMTAWLIRQGFEVNPKRVRRLMRLLGLEAIYPKQNLSIASAEHKKYPYLLRDVLVERPDQVWSTDITYIKMAQGFLVPGGDNGLVQPVCAGLEAIQYFGHTVLPGRPGGGVGNLAT